MVKSTAPAGVTGRPGPRRNHPRSPVTVLAALVLGLLGTAGPAAAAGGGPVPATQQVYQRLGVDQVQAAYVVLIDTSKSMNDPAPGGGTLYGTLKKRLRTFLTSLPPGDRVSVITFGKAVNTVQPMGPVTSVGSLIDQGLPPRADERATDFGSALNAAAEQLESSQAPVRSVLLVSDGRLHAPGTPYASTKSAAWRQLRVRYAELAKQTTLTGFGVPLAPRTGLSAVLGQVFATPRILPYRPAQLRQQLDTAKDEVRAGKAVTALKEDDDAGVTGTWSAPSLAPSAGAVYQVGDATGDHRITATLTLRSRLAHVPVDLTGLRLVGAPGGTPVRVSGLPGHLVLQPGRRTHYRVRLSWHQDRPSGLTSGRQSWDTPLRLAGRLSSPWTDVIRGPVADPAFTVGRLAPTTLELRGTTHRSAAAWPYLLVLLALLAAAGTVYGRHVWLNPRLRGRLAVGNLRSGAKTYHPLKGRRMTFDVEVEDIRARMTVRGVRADGQRPEHLRLECERFSPASSDSNNCPLYGKTIVCGIAVTHEDTDAAPPQGGDA